MVVSRRHLLSGAAAATAALGLAGCNGLSKSSSNSGRRERRWEQRRDDHVGEPRREREQRFGWFGWLGTDRAGVPQLVQPQGRPGVHRVPEGDRRLHVQNPDITVKHTAVPYTSVETTINARLQAGSPPDLFRVSYIDIGLYSAKDVLVDLSSTFTAAEIKEFIPAFWSAVSYNGKPYGVPHQTDTTAIAYRKDAMAAAGITNLPTSIDDAWTWDEFATNAAKLKKSITAKNQYPFAYDWQQAGAYRWLSWLYEAGGSMLDPSFKTGCHGLRAGLAALDYTKNFFTQGWVPKNTSVKSTTYTDTAFIAGRWPWLSSVTSSSPRSRPGQVRLGVMPQP